PFPTRRSSDLLKWGKLTIKLGFDLPIFLILKTVKQQMPVLHSMPPQFVRVAGTMTMYRLSLRLRGRVLSAADQKRQVRKSAYRFPTVALGIGLKEVWNFSE